MNRKEVFAFVKNRFETEPDYPWFDENAVLRHKDNKKWYGIVLQVGKDKLGLTGEGFIDVLNVKCDPILIGSLRHEEGYHPAYHMNKDKWLTIRLDGSVPAEEIQNLIELSFELTAPKLKKYRSKRLISNKID